MEFILLLISSLLLTTRAAAASNAILDADGNELQRGQIYYARPAREAGGGLTLAPRRESCPLFVAQERLNNLNGRPLAFFPENSNENTVREGNTMYIMFPEPTHCSESTVWRFDRETGNVRTGGTKSRSAGPHHSRFAIRQTEGSKPHYQIEVCPCSVGVDRPSCRMACVGSLGSEEMSGRNLIGVNTNRPHIVQFEKANWEEEDAIVLPAFA